MSNPVGMPVLQKPHLRRGARLIPIVQSRPITSKDKADSLDSRLQEDKFKGVMVSSLEISKALDFLNSLDDAKPLAEMKTLGRKVANRIMEYKASLAPNQRFTSLAQLRKIPGFGPTKFKELIEQMKV